MARPIPNPYKTLGIPDLSDIEVVKAAYRQLAMQYHPDRNSSAQAQEKMKEVNVAWDALKTPESKQNIDRQLKPQTTNQSRFNPEWFSFRTGDNFFAQDFARMALERGIKLQRLKQQKSALMQQLAQVEFEIARMERETW